MKKHQYLLAVLLLLTCLGGTTTLLAADHAGTDTMDAHLDLVLLNAVMKKMPYLSCTVLNVNDRVSAFTNKHDSLTGQLKIKGQYTLLQFDSSVLVQNDTCNAFIRHSNKNVVLRKIKPARQVMWQLDLLDTAFVKGYVQRMYTVDSAGLKKIKVEFRPGMPYLAYEMVYDPVQMLPVCVKYKIRVEDGTTNGGYDLMHYHFTGFSTASFAESVFSTAPFFNRETGVLKTVAPYTLYTIADYSSLY